MHGLVDPTNIISPLFLLQQLPTSYFCFCLHHSQSILNSVKSMLLKYHMSYFYALFEILQCLPLLFRVKITFFEYPVCAPSLLSAKPPTFSPITFLCILLHLYQMPRFLQIGQVFFRLRTFALDNLASWNVLHPLVYTFCSHTSPNLCSNIIFSMRLLLTSLFIFSSPNTPFHLPDFFQSYQYATCNLFNYIQPYFSKNVKPQGKGFVCTITCCTSRNI